MDKESSRQQIAELVEKFASQSQSYEDPGYNESQTRQDFVNPFFKALGWDIDNEQGHSEVYRDVVYEARVQIDGAAKAPDYTFRLGSEKIRLFFVEAKKPGIHLGKTKEPAYQLRRYAWSSNLPVSILTNFKEFAVYDCRHEPNVNDPPDKTRVAYFTYQNYTGGKFGLIEYEDCFDFLWNTFARENIPKGNLDKFVQSDQFEKGYVTVDQKFLLLIEDWRMLLAQSICRNNPDITAEDLNFVVQQTIDRLVFLRIAEDRRIEPYGNVQRAAATSGTDECYKKLFTLFERADEKYNSGLFNFNTDKVSGGITIKNNVIKDIVKNLYYPSPYDFSAIPVEIMGNIYEHFLGKTIRLTPEHNAVVEEKPEVKKAGGVYYTPQYIVDYIVQNTVGRLIEYKTPKEVTKIKIVDPACGSGSFLLGAYQFLLDWHQDYYQKHCEPSKGRKTDLLTPSGKLTASEKKRILCNNIFGVDIDMIAAEITKWSLLVKGMEGETEASIQTSLLYKERILPNIDSNICVGNSLVDTDIYDSGDFGDERTIKPFHWQRAFPKVFEQGGFDAVIGNPPYVSIRTTDFNVLTKPYFKEHYQLATGQYDIYALFVERAEKLLQDGGLNGFIMPKRMTTNENFQPLRKFYLSKLRIESYVDAGTPFKQASVEANIIIASKSKNTRIKVCRFDKANELQFIQKINIKTADSMPFSIFPFLLRKETLQIIKKIQECRYAELGDFCTITRGFECGFNHPLISKKKSKYKMIRGENIKRYLITEGGYYVQPDFDGDPQVFKTKDIFLKTPKLVTKFVSNKIEFAVDTFGYYNTNVVYNVHINDKIDLHFLLGILNSPAVNFWFKNIYVNDDTLFPHIQKNQLASIPIPLLDLSDKTGKKTYGDIVRSVEQLLQSYAAKEGVILSERKRIEDKIAHYENKINEIVYQLYGL
ncbi:MAG: N-6 DNA methylase, partial [Planctomycetaceae bacterium]|nr:N-6 DNA methylase [Planctomycetaceae bacterium]